MNKTDLMLDLETGGLNRKTDAICEIACKVRGQDDFFQIYIKPYNKRYTPEAQAVHGLTKEFLEKNGVERDDAFQAFYDWLKARDLISYKTQIIGANVHFDAYFLDEQLVEWGGEDSRFIGNWVSHNFKDTNCIGAFLREAGRIPEDQKINNGALCKYFTGEVKTEDLHGALYDCKVSEVNIECELEVIKLKVLGGEL